MERKMKYTVGKVLAVVALVVSMSTGSVLQAEEVNANEVALRLLKDYGSVSFAHKAKYGAGISDMWLGFDADAKPVVGIASRNTKTYAEALAVIAVTPKDGAYKVAAAEIPAIATFHGKSQSYTKDALKDISGRVFKTTEEARGLVDAVSGATKYYKAIYVSYALMSSKVIDELESVPDWPKKPVE
jgi:hypothetical protein